MKKRSSSTSLFGIIIFFAAYGAISQYSLLSILGGISLAVIFREFWFGFFSPIMLYFFGFQWLQVFMSIVFADYKGQNFKELYSVEDADFLIGVTFLQLTVMVAGARYFLKKGILISTAQLRQAAMKFSERRVLTAYLIASIIFPSLLAITAGQASISQLVQAATVVRQILLLLLIFILFLKETPYRSIIIAVIAVEFLLGFASYFSSFKNVIIYLLVVYLTINPIIKSKLLIRIIPLAALLVFLFSFWSSVKGDYRRFLNQDSRQQEVSVSNEAALDFILNRLKTFDKEQFDAGVEIMLERIQYMQLYSLVYSRMPSVLPFEGGENLERSLNFIFTPRIFNKDKGTLDPSTKTIYYTGKLFATAEMGTSISLGYFCDFFIDFGLLGMIIPVALMGMLIGYFGKKILKGKFDVLFSYSLLIAIMLSLGSFESDLMFYLGILRNYAVVLLLANWFIFPRLYRYLTTGTHPLPLPASR